MLIADLNPALDCYSDSGGSVLAEIGDPIGFLPSNGSHPAMIQPDTSEKPTLTLSANGHRRLTYDGADDVLYSANTLIPPSTPCAIIIAKQNVAAISDTVFGTRNGSTNYSIQWGGTDANQVRFLHWEAGSGSLKSTSTNSTPGQISAIAFQNTGTLSQLYLDGSLESSEPVSGIATSLTRTTLGASSSSGSEAWSGDVYRVLYYDSPLTQGELESLTASLLSYYSNPIPSEESDHLLGGLGIDSLGIVGL